MKFDLSDLTVMRFGATLTFSFFFCLILLVLIVGSHVCDRKAAR